MRIFCDWHHGGLGRSMYYLWADRLGHELHIPGLELIQELAIPHLWGHGRRNLWPLMGEDPDVVESRVHYVQSVEEYRATDYDIIVMTRSESQAVLQETLAHPRPGKYVAVSGNEDVKYDWAGVRNLLATDTFTMRRSPEDLHKLLTVQELGRMYGREFVPVEEPALAKVGCFLNNIAGYDEVVAFHYSDWHPQNPYALWQALRATMPDYQFKLWGHGNEHLGGEALTENLLIHAYHSIGLFWHCKAAEGWGHSLLQGVACGRLPLVPQGFFRERNAGRYLAPEFTCVEISPDPGETAVIIHDLTCDLDMLNARCRLCYEFAHRRFNWAEEAERVRQWLGGLQ